MKQLLLLLLLVSFEVCAQKTNQKIIVDVEVDENGSQIIPDNINGDSCDCILMSLENEINGNMEIFWDSNYTDGRYIVVITQNQIFVKSSHENPNPNYLYWVLKIDNNQYLAIHKFMNSSNSVFSKTLIDDNRFLFTKALKENVLNDSWENKLFENFFGILEELKGAKLEGKIDLPSRMEFDSFVPVRIVYDEKECNPIIIEVDEN